VGYCPLTEWHFNILERLGYRELPDSYIVFLLQRLTSLKIDQELANLLIIGLYFVALSISVMVNFCAIRGNESNER